MQLLLLSSSLYMSKKDMWVNSLWLCRQKAIIMINNLMDYMEWFMLYLYEYVTESRQP